MPASLLSSQDIHSDHSDASFRSVESRNSGKKVSFNKAVRVKQYPWHPDESHDVHASPVLSGRRFWFKVYKNNPAPAPQQNAWKKSERPTWPEINGENSHDSLTPIAEDEDIIDGSDTYDQENISNSNLINRKFEAFEGNGNHFTIQPSDPPVDYIDDEYFFSRFDRPSLRTFEQARPESEKSKPEYIRRYASFIDKKNTGNDFRKPKVTNGFLSPVRNGDFRRPTISSAAKCSTDKPDKSQIINVRLPRAVAKESPLEKNKKSIIQPSQRLKERRSRSNDDDLNSERLKGRAEKFDKAVSTEDLSVGPRRYEVDDRRNGFLGAQKKNKDKATQCTGTLTNYSKSNGNITGVLKSSRPAFSSVFTRSENGNPRPVQRHGDKASNFTVNGTSPKLLTVQGKSCISGVKRNGLDATEIGNNTDFNTRYNGRSNYCNNERLEYDYVTDMNANNVKSLEFKEQPATSLKSLSKKADSDYKYKPPSWRTMVDNNFNSNSVFFNEDEAEDARCHGNAHVRSSSTIGHLRGKQIPLNPNQHVISPTLVKETPISITDPKRNFTEIETTDRFFKNLNDERKSCSAMVKGSGYGLDDIESPIDWSMSGFRLGSRYDNNLSSSSDSECIVHRRAPLLMYIPGVSHHHKPAVEDDRLSALSGMSRSEAEDDLSPLSIGAKNEFKRRYSMPRNGKLNFLKWKSNKKIMKQT